jgi:hypothetical protein
MKKIIFLDFDGVLHPDGEGLFSQREIFESYLLKMPDVEVIVSSTWREDYDLNALREFFSPSVRHQIQGVTPVLEDGCDQGGRQREIHAYLEAAGLNDKNATWVVLDDMAMFFEAGYPYVILTESTRGFDDSNGETLLRWYGSKCQRV